MAGQYILESHSPSRQNPPGTKRTSDVADSAVAPPSKVAKINNATSSSKGKKGNRRSAKVRFFFYFFLMLTASSWCSKQEALSRHRFMANAAPFHVNLTHTPPTTDADGDPTAPADPGFIGNLILVPTNFTTGSYGWKGSRRIVIGVQDPRGTDSETNKLQVMLTSVAFSCLPAYR